MPNFSFKKEVEVRVVYPAGPSGTQYKIDVSEIDFGQTFQENSFEVKTLHNQGSFEGSVTVSYTHLTLPTIYSV